MRRFAWTAAFFALVAAAVACKHEECKEDEFRCEGNDGRTCVEGKWVVQRCKAGCAPRPHWRCDTVDDPKIGEGCYDDRVASEGFLSSPIIASCSPDKKSMLICNTAGGDRWRLGESCGARGCDKHACRDMTTEVRFDAR